VIDEIRQYLLKNSAVEGIASIDDEQSLLEAGVIDSVAMVDLIAFLETNYKITINEDDMMPENFDTLESIAQFIGRMQQSQ
jgi:acyl carrier protein